MNAQYENLKTFAVLVYGHVYIILRNQNKVTDFLTISALASPFKSLTHHHVVENVISIETNDHYFFYLLHTQKQSTA